MSLNGVISLQDIENNFSPAACWRKVVENDATGRFVAFLVLKEENKALFVEKCVVVTEDMSVTVSCRGRLTKSPDNVDTITRLTELLENIEKLKVCSGCPNSSAGTLVSNDCKVLSDTHNCSPCSKLWLKRFL